MKKVILSALALLLSAGAAMAEGYQVNSLSAKQLGMGHTGVALELGAESMFFNPAGMAFMNKTLDLSGSFTAIMPTATATVQPEGKKYDTDCNAATPIGAHAAFSIYDNLKAGVSFYTPYGSSINWTDNWPGAVLNQNVNLKVFTVQPTVAWAITPKLSVGIGAMISWGSVDLNKGLVTPETADKMITALKDLGQLPAETPAFGNTTPTSINLTGTAKVTVGFNVGAMYKFNEKLNFGASFRSRMPMRVKAGNASVHYATISQGLLGDKLGLINNANFTAEMPCPWVLGLGVAYKPIDRLTLAFDARLTGWHTYKKLDIEFLDDNLTKFNQNIEKHYKNSWCYSLGAQYAVTERFDARVGLMVDTSPVNKNFYNPETPGMTKVEPTVGLSFRPIPRLSIDVAFMYVHGCGVKGASCEYTDLLGKMLPGELIPAIKNALLAGGIAPNPEAALAMAQAKVDSYGFEPSGKFTADYKLHAFIPSIGISYSF
ncbi:MAG: outer membrane protein transport protein [Paenibacillus sp.]|nr:outer membrane protein transport protein [Paenibacillus sp.]